MSHARGKHNYAFKAEPTSVALSDSLRANHRESSLERETVPKSDSNETVVTGGVLQENMAGETVGGGRDKSTRWLFVPLCFLLYMLVYGIIYSMGIYYDSLRSHFDSSNLEISWLTSVLISSSETAGPLVSACIHKIGCRRAAMLGALLAAVSIFVSTFSPNLPTLIVTFGFLGGCGLCFIAVPAVVQVGRYFHRRRALVTGLVCSGGGIGSLFFPPMLNYFLLTYGWKGSLWILAGIVLNGVCFGYACRVVTLKMTPIKPQSRPQNELLGPCFSQEASENHTRQQRPKDDSDEEENVDVYKRRFKEPGLMCASDGAGIQKTGCEEHVFTVTKAFPVQGLRQGHDLELVNADSDGLSSPGVNSEIGMDLRLTWKTQKKQRAGRKCNVFRIWIPSTFVPPLAHTLGIDSTNAALLVSIMGIANIISRVVIGFVCEQPWADLFIINGLVAVVAGVATSVVPFLKTYTLLAVYCGVFGFCTGTLITVRSPICVEMLGVHKLTQAFGWVSFAHGLGSLIGAPLTGFLADATGDYSVSFHVMGGVVSLAGVVSLPLRRILRWEKHRR
ncbi:hypothetical protein BaRGS_00021576 [Batillaria attramentaria]|uniref:Major facilitator superfamily (MFS) profile domain-containing protein n=1 Tax=Batillaria attramentaria TaxID=370345 RepID=A0ABD0KJF4_9CAEN